MNLNTNYSKLFLWVVKGLTAALSTAIRQPPGS